MLKKPGDEQEGFICRVHAIRAVFELWKVLSYGGPLGLGPRIASLSWSTGRGERTRTSGLTLPKRAL